MSHLKRPDFRGIRETLAHVQANRALLPGDGQVLLESAQALTCADEVGQQEVLALFHLNHATRQLLRGVAREATRLEVADEDRWEGTSGEYREETREAQSAWAACEALLCALEGEQELAGSALKWALRVAARDS